VSEGEPLSAAKRALLERALLRRRESAGASTTIPRRGATGPAPLSFAQQRMWFLEQWEPGAPTFNGARAFRLRGVLDRAALERSLRAVIARHESLRTIVVPGAEALQAVPEDWSFELSVVPGPSGDPAGELDELLRELSRKPFDLTRDLMLRATLLELGDEEGVLLLGMHHIAADAHSDSVLFAELAECYEAYSLGREPRLPELPIQYADYAVWQHERLQGALLEELRSYWARTLEDAPELLRLPSDRPRLAVQRHDGSHHRFELDRQLADGLLALGRQEGATLFITMLAAFTTLLYRLSGEEDIVIGSPIANRNNLELQGLIGFFTNTIALRTRLGGNPTFREVVGRARATALGAYAHQDLPFEKVVEAVAPKRDPGHNPLFQVNFRAQASERPALALTGVQVEPIAVDIGFSRFDLALELELGPRALGGFFEFDRDLFDLTSVVGFEQDLRALLTQVVENPDVPILALGRERRPPKAAGRSIRRSTR
jgi:hypothetical protein